MSIVSFYYIAFLLLTIIIYYLFPKKHRWPVLLLSSIVFFLVSVIETDYKLIFYPLMGILVSYVGSNIIYRAKKGKKLVLFLTIFILLGTLILLKWFNIIPMTLNVFGKLFDINTHYGTFNILAPLGISYYTLSLIGYVVDVYVGAYEAEKNPFKLCLYGLYYPILVSGPFVRYSKMKEELFSVKEFEYSNIFIGFERIIFGFMKKLVIADTLAPFVKAVFADYQLYSGYYIIIALVLYAIQIYCDFSGCMDIVIGTSKMYGINLDENFNSPFLSRNLSEFWRRWHISLGLWGRDYIMYPLLKSNAFQKLGKKIKKIFGKKTGKLITTLIPIFILWLLIGLWHGASFRYIFCAGILPWIYLASSQIFEGLILKINQVFHIRTECFSFQVFRILRTLMLMCFIWLFACSPSLSESIDVMKSILVIKDTNLFESLPQLPMLVLFISLGLVFAVDYYNYKEINLFEEFQKQNIVFKYAAVLFVMFLVLMYGAYGPGFNASDFIYGGF